ncbi:MAG: dephospho-CoA kinase [Synechococcaceae cyanobacterium SM2_3_2]|nr:dephospho-CoA kinase [Synechococcaceae cyanobacterium SM2_3_2]
MTRPFLIGLTGGIATGKSTVAGILMEQGIPVLDADRLARDAVAPGSEMLAQLHSRYGDGILWPNGSLHRQGLASLIFRDPAERAWVESLIHPYVRDQMEQGIQEWQKQGIPIGCLMIPLLFEAGLENGVDVIWVVSCDLQQQRERLQNRDHLSDPEIEARLSAQWPLERKCQLASTVLNNNRDPQHLRVLVWAALEELPTCSRQDHC